MVADGTITAPGSCRRLAVLLRTPARPSASEPFQLGSSEQEAEHWLLVDRHLGTLDVGLAHDVRAVLATQPSELQALVDGLSLADAAALLEHLLEHLLEDHLADRGAKAPEKLRSDIQAQLEREEELLRALRVTLDEGLQTIVELLERHDRP